MPSNNTSEDQAYYNKEEQAQVDLIVAQAVEAAAKGENVDQLLEVMLTMVSSEMKETVRKKLIAALKKRGLKTPGRDNVDVPARSTLARLREALTLTARQAFERVAQLMRARPDVASRVQQAGQILASYGVKVERIQIREADLGTLAPTAVSKAQTIGDQGRGGV